MKNNPKNVVVLSDNSIVSSLFMQEAILVGLIWNIKLYLSFKYININITSELKKCINYWLNNYVNIILYSHHQIHYKANPILISIFDITLLKSLFFKNKSLKIKYFIF
jgi:hypothetical protein